MNKQSTEDRQRAGLMAALSAAEHIVANSPAPPSDVAVSSEGVDVLFHRRPEAVAEFAAKFGLEARLEPAHGGQPRPYVEARGLVCKVTVHAWAWGAVGELDRYRAAVGVPVGVPSAWRAVAGAA